MNRFVVSEFDCDFKLDTYYTLQSQQIGEVKTHSVADQSSSIPLALVSKDDSTNDTIPDPFIVSVMVLVSVSVMVSNCC